MTVFFSQLFSYRRFIFRSVIDDYRKRYTRSKFALLWTVLHPIVQVAVFALVFANMLGARMPGNAGKYAFAVYMLSGVLVWGLFADTLNRITTIFVEFGGQIKKIVFPKTLPVAIAAGIAISNFLILFIITLLLLIFIDNAPSVSLLLSLVPFAFCAIALGVGLGLIFGTLNVFMRDVGQVVSIVMTFWFWFTPVIYQASQLPAHIKPYADLNPASPIVSAFQSVMLSRTEPNMASLLWPFVCAFVFCVLGGLMLYRSSPQMADVL